MTDDNMSRWLKEFDRYLPVKKLFILHGNINDMLAYPVNADGGPRSVYLPLRELLHTFLVDRGYELTPVYDIVDGLKFASDGEQRAFMELGSGADSSRRQGQGASGLDQVLAQGRRALAVSQKPAALIIDYASQLASAPGHLAANERAEFIQIAKSVQEAARVTANGQTVNNIIILICNKLSDLPAWLYFDHPLAKPLQIDLPTAPERRRFFELVADGFFNAPAEGRGELVDSYVDLTHGLKITDLESLRLLSVREQIAFDQPKNLVKRYKFGVHESAWDTLGQPQGRAKLMNARGALETRVKGQPAAVQAVESIIKRAAVGLSGVQHSSSGNKPRGVLFFAGPTGVGKTEMAKALAELLFGDESACVRFDMSEYSQEHSDEKLLGAPPGYVGYEEGGQLTNKVKESPFSVLLFDEIEKAHPKILDKFLQILEDGRMTDGRGETVYFSESIIVFTSNLGAYVDEQLGDGRVIRKPNILPYAWKCAGCGEYVMAEDRPVGCPGCGKDQFEHVETPYSLVRDHILKAVENHFKFKLGRPEIYNRIGNNFVVFDYIRPTVVDEIIGKVLMNIAREMSEKKHLNLTFEPAVMEFIRERAARYAELGGRGIGNLVETVLVNPLAQFIFDHDGEGADIVVKRVTCTETAGVESYSLDAEFVAASEGSEA
jgi:rubrerythrin